MDCSPPGSSVHGILQARLLEWVVMPSFSAAAAAAKSLQSCPTLSDPMDWQPTRLLHPWDFPGKCTGVGCHCLLQGRDLVNYKSSYMTWIQVLWYWTSSPLCVLSFHFFNSLFPRIEVFILKPSCHFWSFMVGTFALILKSLSLYQHHEIFHFSSEVLKCLLLPLNQLSI